MKNCYTQIRQLFREIGVVFEDSGDASDNRGKQVEIEILDEQGTAAAITLYFQIDTTGNESFVCQE